MRFRRGSTVTSAFEATRPGNLIVAEQAEEALGKALAVLPPSLRDTIPDAALFAVGFHVRSRLTAHLGLFVWGDAWSAGAWCELREGFRNFRLDRVEEVRETGETYPDVPGRRLADLFRHYDSPA